ncbi:MAG: hypothetical protein GX610_11840 [Rhodococcus sp.]|nr:hypothetical protein [Rhodococcus sp. (in: high G+C Gram-positive bacteria)]
MSQLSFFSAESTPPAVVDLGGLLAGTGQAVTSDAGARVSVVVEDGWRAEALAQMIDEAGVPVETTRSDEGRPLVRTHSVEQLRPLVGQWTRGAVKAVPHGWVPTSRQLRMWTIACGRAEAEGTRFVLGLDPHAPQTHGPLARCLMHAGIAPTLIGTRGATPGLRIAGRRRLARLAESVGEPPPHMDVEGAWPYA